MDSGLICGRLDDSIGSSISAGEATGIGVETMHEVRRLMQDIVVLIDESLSDLRKGRMVRAAMKKLERKQLWRWRKKE